MAQDAGYSILTHYISVDVFISMIESDIKKLIRKFGHINCGLRHEELCEELKKYINQKKTPILSLMNEEGKKEWNTKWSRKRSEFFNRLFEEEGFINMCYPKKYTDEPKLYQFKSKHIQFCQERDVWKEDVEKNNEYNECVRYNMWINTETASLTREFLSNVRVSSLPTVKKYFSTKTQPKGYEPPDIYRKSKLDCEIYNPASKRYQQKSVTKASPNNPHTSTSPDVRQESHGKGGISMPDEGKIEITKSHVKELPKSESPDSLTSSITKTEVDDTASGKQPSTDPENTSIKSTSSHDTTNDQQNNYKVILQGSPVVDSVPIFQPIPDSHPNPDDEYLKLQSFFYSHLNNLDGQKITQDMHERIYTKPVMFPKTYPTYIHSNPMVSILTKGYNNILPKNTRAKHHPPVYTHVLPFQKANSTASQFTQNRKPWKTGSSFFHQELPPFYSTIKGIIKNY
ncbi:unspecified product [Plasmodium ovale wallikeri]|uniref:Unspecified product n=1 Tax=Plasmodium ovale wallikeri TaxID=864142 RepID=A0A1A9AKG7_PLAOA|nr:unspecified product [Plasmodium ovale wallikeri]SBT57998.1 unspecified product [Plasmodium ovale wallikeri]